MRLWKKGLSVILTAGLLAAMTAGSAWAAEERTKISSVTLTVSSSIAVGDESGDVNVTSADGSYNVTDIEVLNDEGEWTVGDSPRVKITLEADEGYYFTSMSKSTVRLRGSDASYVTSSRKYQNETLYVTIRLDELEGTLEVADVAWEDDESPIARWEDADGGATNYQVRLYRGSNSVGSTVTTTNNYYNFSSSITREGDYYFKVRAVNKNGKKGDWYESDYIYIDDDMLYAIRSGYYSNISNASGASGGTSGGPNTTMVQGTWLKDNIGWWYQYPNGDYPRGGWLEIGGKWYCFDNVGYMRTGWIVASDNCYYYCDPTPGSNEGAMLTNTRIDGVYWVDASGKWIPGV